MFWGGAKHKGRGVERSSSTLGICSREGLSTRVGCREEFLSTGDMFWGGLSTRVGCREGFLSTRDMFWGGAKHKGRGVERGSSPPGICYGNE